MVQALKGLGFGLQDLQDLEYRVGVASFAD